jgi:hypothetical protein
MGVLNNPLQFVSPSVVVYRDYGALNECMRPGYVGNLFDFLNAQYPQIGMPSVVSEYWIMICTDPSRWTVSGLNLINKAAYRYSVYVCVASSQFSMRIKALTQLYASENSTQGK